MSLLFNQPCPTCGRKQKIRVELLGRIVACQHCSAEFTASDRAEQVCIDPAQRLMSRVEQALKLSQPVTPADVAAPAE